MTQRFNLPFAAAIAMAVTTFLGCGGKETPPQAAAPSSAAVAVVAPAVPAVDVDVTQAGDTVSQFLDAVRRGGGTQDANALLTSDARSVLERLGHSVQPFGTPAAKFQVTRSEAVEQHPGAALVHSTWSEPDEAGAVSTVQIVWALQWEQSAWKISGLAMELAADQDPLIIDFEDYNDMANLFRSQSPDSQPAAVVATAPGERSPGEPSSGEPSPSAASGNLSQPAQPADGLGRF